MRLPHLDQVVELHRGEARALAAAVLEAGQRHAAPPPAALVLAWAPLERLRRRLCRVALAEETHVGLPPRRPRRFRLPHDELIALMLYVVPVATTARVPLGKVQQKSLNLAHLMRFT
ncbi:hypothetical protein JAO73_10555 [Hymenobacter sp. BT523]|uniref:hypothetical protein n=1 Tax=Hymenobacter sp. BT523 TaxID=2795725 RepID=UPI0018EE3A05|nr:hypothetical protein [Hymenobacter sp. BT523]MBJ6109456.1 hypothetical protein [Hymenobacter sp. BT523]